MKIHHRTVRQNHDNFAATEKHSRLRVTHHGQEVILESYHHGKMYAFRGSLTDLCAKLVKLSDEPA